MSTCCLTRRQADVAKLPIPFSNPATYPGHSGVDYAQRRGTPFLASGPGRVTTLSRNARGGFYIWVKYDAIGPEVGYHHMDSHNGCPPVGSRVSEGTRLGYVGNTGNSTGPHLHSEVAGHRTTAGYWKFFDSSRVVGGGSGKIAEDGELGPATIRALQKALGVTQDGDWGPATTLALQKKLIATGHKIDADGDLGPATIRAMQIFLLGAKHADGEIGPQTIRGLQHYLNAGGKFVIVRPPAPAAPDKLVVDGDWGPATTKALQRSLGVTVDGELGPETYRAWQKALGVPVDGEMGPQTRKAYQTAIGATPDGEVGPETVRKLQEFLNAGKKFTKVTLPEEPVKPAPTPAATPRVPVYPAAVRGWNVPLSSDRPASQKIDRLIVHHQGSTNDDEEYFKKANERSSCPTWQVKTDGTVVELIAPDKKPSSTGSWNARSVAIETQNSSGAPDWGISDAAHEAIAEIAAWCSKQPGMSIELDRTHIIGHNETGAATACPGPSMDLDRIVARAKEIVAPEPTEPDLDVVPVSRAWLEAVRAGLNELLE